MRMARTLYLCAGVSDGCAGRPRQPHYVRPGYGITFCPEESHHEA